MREQAARIEQRQVERDSRPGSPIYSNWVLIAVTAFAVGAAFMTLAALRKQVAANTDAAKAAMQSAQTADKHFVLTHEQWFDLLGWHAEYSGSRDGPPTIAISFRLLNGTPNRIILNSLSISVDGIRFDSAYDRMAIRPRGDHPGNVSVELDSAERFGECRNGTLALVIQGEIGFIDAIGTSQVQRFAMVCSGGTTILGEERWDFQDADWISQRTPAPEQPNQQD
jgi:hypothetical protein